MEEIAGITILYLGGDGDGQMKSIRKSDAHINQIVGSNTYRPGSTHQTKKYGTVQFFISLDLHGEELEEKLEYWDKEFET